MGGCCCCSSKDTDLTSQNTYYYYPRVSEEHVPLSSNHAAANLEHASIPDTYTPPPAPTPFNVTSPAGPNHHEASPKLDDLKVKTDLELPKLLEPILLEQEDEDACPICLEEYDADNPKLTTKCDHYFHLACLLEWMERSETCPVCDQDMLLNPLIIH